ncbi:uncharacterized protein LOC129914986 [Episyrphus balteatus]|uniref:uncharacterized protein LOC129914986 n=1 Tax=Episyrphus balteatus TaxID=286459 RepID=UPI002485B584|nr:uncharacterized protein LOC129914986 [Episyrphus balteatus]
MNKNDLPLSSKVIFQSPMVENVYKEFILSSKPINLKKYATAKPKHSLNDSKIYYIPIGPMPYHFSHGPGYDYQPYRLNSGVQGNKQPVPPQHPIINGPNVPQNFLQAFLQNFQKNPQNYLQKLPQNIQQNKQQNVPQNVQSNYRPNSIVPNRPQIVQQIVPQSVPHNVIASNSQPTPVPAVSLADTMMTRLNGHAYYFNGRPYNLKAYRASPKLNVDKHNLESHLFFNKNIIY